MAPILTPAEWEARKLAGLVSDFYLTLEEIGKRSGHLIAECPRCHELTMVPYSSPKQLLENAPKCIVCLPSPAPRVVVLGDPNLVIHKKPGQPRTRRQLERDGFTINSAEPPPPPLANGEVCDKPAVAAPQTLPEQMLVNYHPQDDQTRIISLVRAAVGEREKGGN